jgi:putative membrane protein
MTTYLIFKALHLIAMVAWFAGLFYLPRLFVYHVEKPQAAEIFKVMEFKLSRYIMLPAAIATLLFGVLMIAVDPSVFQMGWIHAKLTCVLLLVAYHASLEVHRMNLAEGASGKSGRYFRMYNEIPTILLVVIVLLAVLKPF